MLERGLLVLLAAILTLITLVAVAGPSPFGGKTLLTLTTNHGVEQGDVPVAAIWLVGMGALAMLWRRLP